MSEVHPEIARTAEHAVEDARRTDLEAEIRRHESAAQTHLSWVAMGATPVGALIIVLAVSQGYSEAGIALAAAVSSIELVRWWRSRRQARRLRAELRELPPQEDTLPEGAITPQTEED